MIPSFDGLSCALTENLRSTATWIWSAEVPSPIGDQTLLRRTPADAARALLPHADGARAASTGQHQGSVLIVWLESTGTLSAEVPAKLATRIQTRQRVAAPASATRASTRIQEALSRPTTHV